MSGRPKQLPRFQPKQNRDPSGLISDVSRRPGATTVTRGGEPAFTPVGVVLASYYAWRRNHKLLGRKRIYAYCEMLAYNGAIPNAQEFFDELSKVPKDVGAKKIEQTFADAGLTAVDIENLFDIQPD